MHTDIPKVFGPPGEAHFSPFPQTYEIRSKVYPIQKVHQIQKVYLIGIVFTNMLPYKHIFQSISSLTPGLTPRWIGRSWQISFFAVKCAIEERFSPQLSSTYCSFREDGMFYKAKGHKGQNTHCAELLCWSAEQPRGRGNGFATQRSCRCPGATMEDPLSLLTGPCCQLAQGGLWESLLLAL